MMRHSSVDDEYRPNFLDERYENFTDVVYNVVKMIIIMLQSTNNSDIEMQKMGK